MWAIPIPWWGACVWIRCWVGGVLAFIVIRGSVIIACAGRLARGREEGWKGEKQLIHLSKFVEVFSLSPNMYLWMQMIKIYLRSKSGKPGGGMPGIPGGGTPTKSSDQKIIKSTLWHTELGWFTSQHCGIHS